MYEEDRLSMDVAYEATLSDCLKLADELFRDLSGAMEADTSNVNMTETKTAKASSATDQANNRLSQDATKGNDVQDFVKRLQEENERTAARLERINRATLKVLTATWNGNEEFLGNFSTMEKTYKLQETYTAINWSYGHNAEQYLVSKLTKLRAVLNTNIQYLQNWQNIPDDAIIRKSGAALDKSIVESMGAPSSIDTTKEYMGHLRAQFRGRKSEKEYRAEMANGFVSDIRNFAKTRTSYNEHMQAAIRAAKQVQSISTAQVRSARFIDSDRRMIFNLARTADKFIISYATMINFSYRLAIEYILNRRLLLTRMYQK